MNTKVTVECRDLDEADALIEAAELVGRKRFNLVELRQQVEASEAKAEEWEEKLAVADERAGIAEEKVAAEEKRLEDTKAQLQSIKAQQDAAAAFIRKAMSRVSHFKSSGDITTFPVNLTLDEMVAIRDAVAFRIEMYRIVHHGDAIDAVLSHARTGPRDEVSYSALHDALQGAAVRLQGVVDAAEGGARAAVEAGEA